MKPGFPGRIVGAAVLLVLTLAACGTQAPAEGPEAVAKRFYELIAASKSEGGTTPASEAFKLIDQKSANLNVHQFLEIIKSYPPGFTVSVGSAQIKGSQALVAIRFTMPSSFGGGYEVKQELPLILDSSTNTWKVDFAGDSYGMRKEDYMAGDKDKAEPRRDR